MNPSALIFRVHAVQRMFERHISVQSVAQAIRAGKIIEDYSAEMLEPSQLILGSQGNLPLHVVTAENQNANEIIIITAYLPDPGKWHKDSKRRRS